MRRSTWLIPVLVGLYAGSCSHGCSNEHSPDGDAAFALAGLALTLAAVLLARQLEAAK